MSVSKEEVQEWFEAAIETDEFYDTDLAYMSEGDSVSFDSVPSGYAIKIEAMSTDRGYDSYGYQHLDDGYIVFKITDPDGESETFKLPVEYASYEGWSYDVSKLAPTTKQEKVVRTWEWV